MADLDPNTQDVNFEEIKIDEKKAQVKVWYKRWYALVIALIIIIIAGYFAFFSGSDEPKKNENKEEKGKKELPVTPATPSTSMELEKKLDSLVIDYNNFKSATDAKFDSLAAPAWFKKLDKDAQGGVQ